MYLLWAGFKQAGVLYVAVVFLAQILNRCEDDKRKDEW